MRRSLSYFILSVVAMAAVLCCQKPAEPAAAPVVASTANTPVTGGSEMEQAGVPLYPGATIKGQASTPGATPADGKHFNALLSTSDPVAKVVTFYKDSLKFGSSEKNGVTQFVGRTSQGADIILFVEPDGTATKVTVRGILYQNSGEKKP